MVKTGVIGLGYWGPNLLRNLYSNKRRGELVMCDSDPARLEKIRSRYPDVSYTSDCQELFNDSNLDAVVIATDVSSHMVGHTFMFSPPVIKTKEIIDSGELGDIHFITSSRVNLGLHQKDVSVIWDLAPHDFSMLFYWLGEEPSGVSAFGHAYVLEGIPDVAFINLAFPSGAIGNVQVAWLAPSKLRRTVIVGSRKMLVYDDTEPIEKIKVYDKGVDIIEPESFGEYQLTYRTGDIISPKLPTGEPLAAEMEEFLSCIETGNSPKSSGEEGLAVVRALELADASLRKAD